VRMTINSDFFLSWSFNDAVSLETIWHPNSELDAEKSH
jgi:hypothetical protein